MNIIYATSTSSSATSTFPFNRTVTAIVASLAACFLVVIIISFIMFYRYRGKSARRALPSFVSNRLNWRKSTGSESLTSFDTCTDDGEAASGQKEQDQLTSHQPPSDWEVSEQYPLMQKSFSEIAASTSMFNASLLAPSVSMLEPRHPSGSNADTSFDSFYSTSPPINDKDKYQSVTLQNCHTRSPSMSKLPRLITTGCHIGPRVMSTPGLKAPTMTPYRWQPLTPIADELLETKTPAVSTTPSSLARSALSADISNLCLPSYSGSRSGWNRSRSQSGPAISNGPRIDLDATSIITKSGTATNSYLDAKPLPPYPVAILPVISPPPSTLEPPTRMWMQRSIYTPPSHDHTLEFTDHDSSARNSTSKRRSRQFRELLSPSGRNRRRNLAAVLSDQHSLTQRSHISSQSKSTPYAVSVQPPRPVLTLDTSDHSTSVNLQTSASRSRSALTSAVSPKTVSTAYATTSALTIHKLGSLQTPMTITCLSSIADLIASEQSNVQRPISNTATVGSLVSPPFYSSPILSKDETRIETRWMDSPFAPQSRPLPSRINTSTSALISIYSESDASLSRIVSQYEPRKIQPVGDSTNRSPSMSVPIMFRLSFPGTRSSSRQHQK